MKYLCKCCMLKCDPTASSCGESAPVRTSAAFQVTKNRAFGKTPVRVKTFRNTMFSVYVSTGKPEFCLFCLTFSDRPTWTYDGGYITSCCFDVHLTACTYRKVTDFQLPRQFSAGQKRQDQNEEMVHVSLI